MRKRWVILLSTLASVSILALGGLYLARRPLQAWVRTQVQEIYHRDLAPLIPIEIRSVDWAWSFKALLQGRLNDFKIHFIYPNPIQDIEIEFQGPLSFWQNPQSLDYAIEYFPEVKIAAADGRWHFKQIQIWAQASTEHLKQFGMKWEQQQWSWDDQNLKIQNPFMELLWKDQRLRTRVATSGMSWEASDESGLLAMGPYSLRFSAPFDLKKMNSIGPYKLVLKLAKNEGLIGDRYFNFDFTERPIELNGNIRWKLQSQSNGSAIDQILTWVPKSQLTIGQSKSPLFRGLIQSESHTIRLRSQILVPSVVTLLNEINSGLDQEWLADLGLKSGRLELQNDTRVPKAGIRAIIDHQWDKINGLDRWRALGLKSRGMLRLNEVSIYRPEDQVALKDFEFELPYDLDQKTEGKFSTDRIQIKNLQSRLEPFPFQLQFGENIVYLLSQQDLTLRSQQLDSIAQLKIGKINGWFKWESNRQFKARFVSSLLLKGNQIRPMGEFFCEDLASLPDLNFQFDLPTLVYVQDHKNASLLTFGDSEIQTLGGKVAISGVKIYNLLTGLPETQLNLFWDGIRLRQVGEWLNFGKMDGRVQGYFRDVVLQGTLPTQYDFRAEVVPLEHSDIVFSADAMKNVVRVVSGDSVDQHLPGIADWLAFGFPSRLFGGYDVQYAGLELLSKDGSILVTTLDPPEIVKKEQKHFILYGPRFKIPIISSRYPVVLDASALANMVVRIMGQLSAIQSSPEEGAQTEDLSVEEKPNETKTIQCFPNPQALGF